MLSETKRLIQAVEEYINYDHSGDPWEEDSRAMGEMSLDGWKRDGSLDKLKAMLEVYSDIEKNQKDPDPEFDKTVDTNFWELLD